MVRRCFILFFSVKVYFFGEFLIIIVDVVFLFDGGGSCSVSNGV